MSSDQVFDSGLLASFPKGFEPLDYVRIRVSKKGKTYFVAVFSIPFNFVGLVFVWHGSPQSKGMPVNRINQEAKGQKGATMYILVSRFIDSKGYFDNIRANWNTKISDALALRTSKAKTYYEYDTPPMLDIGPEHLDFWDDGDHVIMYFIKSKMVLVYKNMSGNKAFAVTKKNI
jgi:hypothetical protein